MIYDRIVEKKFRGVFAELSKGNAEPFVQSLAPEFTYQFEGETTFGAKLSTHEGVRRWWAHLFDLLPGVSFEVNQIIVKGPPWATNVAVELAAFTRRSDEKERPNPVMQFSELRWGKLTRVHTLEDTLLVKQRMEALAAQGKGAALAPSIADHR